jgi:hypothetical protein
MGYFKNLQIEEMNREQAEGSLIEEEFEVLWSKEEIEFLAEVDELERELKMKEEEECFERRIDEYLDYLVEIARGK